MSTITIVGAGIAGPMTALTLARAGHKVTVYEQRESDALYSAGLLGITQENWAMLAANEVNLARELPNRRYREYGVGVAMSPYRWIIWTDLHNTLTRAAMSAGAKFHFRAIANAATMPGDYVIDAGGIVSAAHRGLAREYLGSIIYRGLSDLPTREAFTTVKLPNKAGFLDIGQTLDGEAFWAMGVRRPAPEHLATTFTDVPPSEVADLPRQFRRVVMATRQIMVLPQSKWAVADTLHDPAWRHLSLGDANGPVRPITTSGANLALQAGSRVTDLLAGSEALAAELLRRRAYAIDLGLRLRGPEIGGTLEDPDYARNHAALYEW